LPKILTKSKNQSNQQATMTPLFQTDLSTQIVLIDTEPTTAFRIRAERICGFRAFWGSFWFQQFQMVGIVAENRGL